MEVDELSSQYCCHTPATTNLSVGRPHVSIEPTTGLGDVTDTTPKDNNLRPCVKTPSLRPATGRRALHTLAHLLPNLPSSRSLASPNPFLALANSSDRSLFTPAGWNPILYGVAAELDASALMDVEVVARGMPGAAYGLAAAAEAVAENVEEEEGRGWWNEGRAERGLTKEVLVDLVSLIVVPALVLPLMPRPPPPTLGPVAPAVEDGVAEPEAADEVTLMPGADRPWPLAAAALTAAEGEGPAPKLGARRCPAAPGGIPAPSPPDPFAPVTAAMPEYEFEWPCLYLPETLACGTL